MWLCSLKHRWEDLCKFRFFPYRNQYSFQLYELDDDYIQQEIQKPPKQTSCTVSFSCLAVLILILIFFCVCLLELWAYDSDSDPSAHIYYETMQHMFQRHSSQRVFCFYYKSHSNVHCIVWMSYISQFWTLYLNLWPFTLFDHNVRPSSKQHGKTHKEIELSYSIFLGTSLSEKWRK